MIELIALFFGCGHTKYRTLEQPMHTPVGYWSW